MMRGLAMYSRRSRGFSLASVLVVVVVLGVLVTLGVPSLGPLVAGLRVRTVASELHASLLRARSEAVKRNVNVTVSATGGDWSQGWSVADPAGTALVAAPATRAQLTGQAMAIVFNGHGRVSSGAGGIEVRDPRNSAVVRCVSVDINGRIQVRQGVPC